MRESESAFAPFGSRPSPLSRPCPISPRIQYNLYLGLRVNYLQELTLLQHRLTRPFPFSPPHSRSISALLLVDAEHVHRMRLALEEAKKSESVATAFCVGKLPPSTIKSLQAAKAHRPHFGVNSFTTRVHHHLLLGHPLILWLLSRVTRQHARRTMRLDKVGLRLGVGPFTPRRFHVHDDGTLLLKIVG